MARQPKFSFVLPDNRRVGYSLSWRGKYISVQFPDPAAPPGSYKHLKIGTGCTTENDAHTEAAKIVLKVYAPSLPVDPKKITWDKAVSELQSSPLRPDTLSTYQTAINNLRAVMEQTKGPNDITPELAKKFARLFAAQTFKRSKQSDAKEYRRSPQTVWNAVANLAIIWSHFADLGFVTGNPWKEVKRPKLPKRQPKAPDEELIGKFLAWFDGRFPGWETVRLFLEVKMLTGRRLLDLSQLRSDQLDPKGQTIRITADQDKTHRELVFPIPPDVFARLWAIRGKTYLWERYAEDTATYRPGRRREKGEFRPSLIYNGIDWIFDEWNRTHPDTPVRSHDLRKRAITLTTMATGNVDKTAHALGIDPQTARRYYLDAQKAFDGAELMRRMADVLRPKVAT